MNNPNYIEQSKRKGINYSRVFDRLSAWLIAPNHICEDKLESPSEESIWSAIRLVTGFYRNDEVIPRRIVPSGEGGICMDCLCEENNVSYEIEKDGRIEKLCFKDSRLVSREDVVLRQGVVA